MIYEFTISRPDPSALRYEAREEQPSQGLTFLVRSSPVTAGAYPEIDEHLKAMHGVTLSVGVTYVPRMKDTFNQATGTWTYKRGGNLIVVHDEPRAAAETF